MSRFLAVLLVLAALLLAGCLNWRGPHYPAAGDERAAVDAAIGAWVAAGRPEPGAEECEPLDRVELVTVRPPPEGRSPCIVLEQGARSWAPACMRHVQPYVGAPWHLAIYLDAELDAEGRRNGIVHESLHAVRGCVLLDLLRRGADPPPWRGEGRLDDAAHEDAELWGPIQNRALAELGR